MMESQFSQTQFKTLVARMDPQSKLVSTKPLVGGYSAQIFALEIARSDGSTYKRVMRLHSAVDLASNPRIAADEYKLLSHLHGAGMPVPQPFYVDDSGDIFGIPCLVIDYIEGINGINVRDAGVVQPLATTLAEIHRITPLDSLGFLPDHDQRCGDKLAARPTELDHSLDEGCIRGVLESVSPLSSQNPRVLLHGDYWLGNTLWRENVNRLAAVIDWEDAALGDPLADLGNSRLELLWALDMDAMQVFTRVYQINMPHLNYDQLPYWDLFAALRPMGKLSDWADNSEQERTMRKKFHSFVAQAFEEINR
jgi:aminoglycoside phosphotransferase (APT) family kinase protein